MSWDQQPNLLGKFDRKNQSQIHIRLQNGDLWLEISYDGAAIPDEIQRGVGFNSMHERASELGGECRGEPHPDGGTRVLARLPVSRG